MGTESKSKEWSPQKELAVMNKLVKIGEQFLQYAKSEEQLERMTKKVDGMKAKRDQQALEVARLEYPETP